MSSAIERKTVQARRIACLLMLTTAAAAGGQMPGAPVLQNAWAAPGIVVALDIGGGSAGTGTSYAGAAGWAPANARFQLSAGAGMQGGTGNTSRGVYGVRLALPVAQMMSGSLGIAAFAGVGGGAGKTTDTLRATSLVPVGAAIGYRRAVGAAGRGFSIYIDPNYQFQSGHNGASAPSPAQKGFFRVGLGVDAGITSRFGITLGVESGATAKAGSVGPHGSLFGLGASMKLGR